MKEMPKEIWLHNITNPSIVGATWLGRKVWDNDVEYVHKDACIDKVCNFIRINAYKYRKIKFVKNKPTFDFRTDWLIEDLRNYMKGE